MTSDDAATRIRILFVAVLCALPLQVAVRERFSEPYPGLYQPSFGGAPESDVSATTLEPDVVVVDRDGGRATVLPDDLMPPSRTLSTAVFKSAFYRPGPAGDPETGHWLRERLLALRPGSDPATVEVQWQDVEHRYADGARTVVGTNRLTVVDVSR